MSQSGPRDLTSVLASRYVLTPVGCAAAGGHNWTSSPLLEVEFCRTCGSVKP